MSAPTTARTGSPVQLSQIVAIVSGVKTRTENALTKAYHQIQKPAPFSGISRTYRPIDDLGEQFPSESTLVQARVEELISDVSAAMVRMLDVVATQDWANLQASADIIVDGVRLVADAPVTYLMWLEKQLVSIRTFVSKLPVLDLGEEWTFDVDAKAWRTPATETTRGKKVPRNHILSVATERHPAQVQVWHEDIVVGYWRTIKFSGAIPASQVFEILERVEKLLDAVRFSRERANTTTVTDRSPGMAIMSYLFQ